MKSKPGILLMILLLATGMCFSQRNPESFRILGIRAYSGELLLRGFYRYQEQSGEKIFEQQKSFYYSGGILLNASTYFLHPNFCQLELNAGYIPESNRDNYLASPDFSEMRTVKKLNISSYFFSQKKISMIASANYDESYARRENMTNVKTISKYLGGSLIYSNKYIPVTFDFYNRKMDQTEIQTGRRLQMEQIHFEGRADQSFSQNDHQKIAYSHKISTTLNENSFFTSNTADDFNFNSNVGLGEKKIFIFNTTICNTNQYGIYNFSRFQAMEDLAVKLPANFSFRTNYNFYNLNQPFGRTIQHTSTNYLSHQLYKSLGSRFYFEYTNINHDAYTEYNSKTGFDFNYTKKIPWGQLNLSYGYFRYRQKYDGDSINLNVVNEEYQLSDSKIVLLHRPYTDKQTILVKDATGTILYKPGLDYFLIERGKYIEIRRIPSGLISNDGTIFVDYKAKQPGSYMYDAGNHAFSTTISLFKGKLDLYYRMALQNYTNLENTDFIALNYFTQNVAGFRLTFNLLSGGAEYEDYKSSILPYHMVRYYLNFQKNFNNKFTVVLNGNMQNYIMLNEPVARLQRYADVSGRVEYTIIRQTRLNLDVMYRRQHGYEMDLNLVTAKLEVTSVLYQLYLTAGVEVYHRVYIGEKINFRGTYIQISRRF
ncbi:MAG: hypothetical protein NTW16_13680 [Bacteroidetes bacterium]|nr:hypothetical protein [Bacteroidota bacterium]